MTTELRPSARALAFRELVTMHLRAEGVEGADGAPITHRMHGWREGSEHRDVPDHSDVAGLSEWLLTVNWHEEPRDISTVLDRAAELADRDHKPLFATVFPRKGRPTVESYAVVPLHILARLITTTQAEAERIAAEFADAQRVHDEHMAEQAAAVAAEEKRLTEERNAPIIRRIMGFPEPEEVTSDGHG